MKLLPTDYRVKSEQLAQMLPFTKATTMANITLVTLLAAVLYAEKQEMAIIYWFFAAAIANMVRLGIGLHFMRTPVKSAEHLNARLNIFRTSLYSVGIMWGASMLLLSETPDVKNALFIAFLFAGLSSSASAAYAIELVSGISFTLCTVLPMAIVYAFSRETTLLAMSFSGFVYVVFVITSVVLLNKRLIEGVLLRFKELSHTEEIKQLAFYDVLTGLPNRRLLLERLEHAYATISRTGKNGAVLFIDLDNFKVLNDTLGHDKGDALLVQVAARLNDCIRESDTVSRFGGDEFVVLLENLNEDYDEALSEAEKVSATILANLNEVYSLGDIDYQSTPSIGLAFLEVHGKNYQDLLKYADIAMYHAKQNGRNRMSVYNDSMATTVNVKH